MFTRRPTSPSRCVSRSRRDAERTAGQPESGADARHSCRENSWGMAPPSVVGRYPLGTIRALLLVLNVLGFTDVGKLFGRQHVPRRARISSPVVRASGTKRQLG